MKKLVWILVILMQRRGRHSKLINWVIHTYTAASRSWRKCFYKGGFAEWPAGLFTHQRVLLTGGIKLFLKLPEEQITWNWHIKCRPRLANTDPKYFYRYYFSRLLLQALTWKALYHQKAMKHWNWVSVS